MRCGASSESGLRMSALLQGKGVFMTLEEHYRISFYQPVRQLGAEEHIWLTRHVGNGKFYVRKELTDYTGQYMIVCCS